MRREPSVFLLILTVVVALAGCSIAQPTVKVDYYALDYQPPTAEKAPALDVVLGVRRFGIAAAYDHDRLVERETGFRTTQSYYHRWANNPRMMLSDLLLRDLRASGNYKAVVMIPANVLPDYEVNGFVQDIVKDVTGPTPQVFISMEVTLLRNQERPEANRVLFQKSCSAQVPCPDQTPSGIAKAMSEAYRDISRGIQRDVYEFIGKATPTNNPPTGQAGAVPVAP